ncbi:HD domain-containing protein [Algicola sagamiensis]|uniref:HD domain-containing protein n=1 Tax=Algicola sagamiensis TaxID=163869 RepID=UPI0003693EF0|nr:HD domain-containing protein [Algicola sagamiensis]
MKPLVQKLESILLTHMDDDAAHDLSHVRRVWKNAQIMIPEVSSDVCQETVLVSCYLHDIVNIPKNDPRRSQASKMAAEKAIYLIKSSLPEICIQKYPGISHAIEAHSFSAGVDPMTLEAKIVQDADRIESLGAMGLARVFYTAGRMKSALFHPEDPLAHTREMDDKAFALDHFFTKLYHLPGSMQTKAGQRLAEQRAAYLRQFVDDLMSEIL